MSQAKTAPPTVRAQNEQPPRSPLGLLLQPNRECRCPIREALLWSGGLSGQGEAPPPWPEREGALRSGGVPLP